MPSKLQPIKIILGSSSMNRRKVLEEMGYQFSILTADIDEKAIRREEPEDLVMALAEAKADAIMARLRGEKDYLNSSEQPTLLITADQVVVHKGKIIEKPSSKEEARRFIKGYSGSCASTVGSVVVSNLKTGSRRRGWDKTEVYFHEIPEEIIDNLVEDDTIFYIAGGLNLENPLTSPLVNAMIGTIDSVRGLPKALTEKLIQEAVSEHLLL